MHGNKKDARERLQKEPTLWTPDLELLACKIVTHTYLWFKPPGLSYIVTVTAAYSPKVPSPQVQDQTGTLIQCVPLGNSMHSQTLAHSCDLGRTQNLLGELVGK